MRTGEHDGIPTRLVIASRTYSKEQSEPWDALTNPDRIPRWFLPVSGDLKVGARYQLEGSSGGLIETCVEPSSFAVTWEYDGSTSWLGVTLEPAETGTTLELVHESPVDPVFWKQYGPGATGLGWDLTMLVLSQHIATGEEFDPSDENAFGVRLKVPCSVGRLQRHGLTPPSATATRLKRHEKQPNEALTSTHPMADPPSR